MQTRLVAELAALTLWCRSWSWTRRSAKGKMRRRRRRRWSGRICVSLLSLLLDAEAPGWGFEHKDGLKAQQNAWGALPLSAPQRHLISVFQTVVCTSGVLIIAWAWAAYDIKHLPINIISSWKNILAPTDNKKKRERNGEGLAEENSILNKCRKKIQPSMVEICREEKMARKSSAPIRPAG